MNAPIHDSESFSIDAEGTSGSLRIDVAIPPSFPEAGMTGMDKPVPVVVVLDGDFCFPAAAALSRLLMMGEVKPHLVAGVGYSDGAFLSRVNERRVFDFSDEGTKLPLPPGQPALRTGGAAAFRDALLDRVIPALADRYPVDPGQIYIYGASMGGWFMGDLLTRDLGKRLAGVAMFSGAFFYGERRVLERLKSISPRDLAGNFKAFVSVGSLEEEGALAGAQMVSDAKALMSSWRDSGFPFEGHVLHGETHNMVFGPAYTRATRYFLPMTATHTGTTLDFDALEQDAGSS